MKRARILVVDDKENFLLMFRRIMPKDIEVVCAPDGELALELLEKDAFDVVVTDVRMPKIDGLTVLERAKARDPEIEVVMMTAFGTIPSAVHAMKLGAVEYLTKPFEPEAAVKAVEDALARRAKRGRRSGVPSEQTPRSYREAVAAERGRATRAYLIQLLKDAQGNVTQAAEKAGVERESLHRLLKRHGLRAEDYRPKS